MNHEQTLEEKRASMTASLVNPDVSPRYITGIEEERVAQLLDETYYDPYRYDGRLVRLGRGLLSRTGLYAPKGPQLVERPWLDVAQEQSKTAIREELALTRIRRISALNSQLCR